MPLDPFADFSRRAWIACPNCAHGSGCPACQDKRNCSEHWQYLLSNQGSRLYLQCRTCTHLWQHDTRA